MAAERGEGVGENVGYTIRLDSKGGPASSLMFCTNGVLLRMLTGAGRTPLEHVTHLVGGWLWVGWRLEGGVGLGEGGGGEPKSVGWGLSSSSCHLSFCGTRSLLPLLQVVDEIHERDRFADFLLILVGG